MELKSICLIYLISAISTAAGQHNADLPMLNLKHLRSLISGYHINRELNANLSGTIEQINESISDILLKSNEIQQTAYDAVILAQEKAEILQNEDDTESLDLKENKLFENIMEEGDHIKARINEIASGLKSILDSRSILFTDGEEEAHRRLKFVIENQYQLHAHNMKFPSRKLLKRFLNSKKKTDQVHYSNDQAADKPAISQDGQKITVDLKTLKEQLVKFTDNNLKDVVDIDVNAVMNDPATEKIMGFVSQLKQTSFLDAKALAQVATMYAKNHNLLKL